MQFAYAMYHTSFSSCYIAYLDSYITFQDARCVTVAKPEARLWPYI